MADLTDKEYDDLDDLWTKTTPKVNFSKGGVFARQSVLLGVLDKVTAHYILACAEANNETPAQVIGKLVREKITASL